MHPMISMQKTLTEMSGTICWVILSAMEKNPRLLGVDENVENINPSYELCVFQFHYEQSHYGPQS